MAHFRRSGGAAAAAAVLVTLPAFAAAGAVSQQLDCDLRGVLYERALALLPERAPLLAVWDALQLTAACGQPRPTPPPAAAQLVLPPQLDVSFDAARPTYYVDPVRGNDGGPGSEAQPFATVERAVRASRAGAGPAAAVLLLPGTHRLAGPIALSPSDSGISFAGVGGTADAPVVVSGGVLLDAHLDWAPWNTTGGRHIYVSRLNLTAAGLDAGAGFAGLFVNDTRAVRARWPNGDPQRAIWPAGYAAAGGWAPPSTAFAPPAEIHVSDPNRGSVDPFWPSFQLCGGPNSTVGGFDPPQSFWGCAQPAQYVLPTGLWWDPATSPGTPPHGVDAWPAAAAAGAGGPGAPVVHAFHQSGWGNWMFAVDGATAGAGNATLSFGPGGWQEARGAPAGGDWFIENLLAELDVPGEWFLQLPQAGGEVAQLYYAFNGSGPVPAPPGAPPQFVAAARETLFTLDGGPGDGGDAPPPVADVAFAGLTFAHTAPTFMRPFTVMSGGDASVYAGAAVVMRGTTRAAVAGCTFTGIGGNALLLHGYNNGTQVTGSEFAWVGDNALVLLGDSQLIDASARHVPQGTVVAGNLFRELGLYVKQAGALYQAISAGTTFARNVVFNVPREGVNVNDGAFGGHAIVDNVLFSTMRETSDGGAINTWDRQPFVSGYDPATGAAVLLPGESSIARNLLLSNYDSLWAVDFDDGSNGFAVRDNVVLYSGYKSYLGFNKSTSGCLYVYADASAGPAGTGDAAADAAAAARSLSGGSGVGRPRKGVLPRAGAGNAGWPYCVADNGVGSLPAGLRDSWTGNTCIASTGGGVYQFSECDPASPLNGGIPVLANNTLLVPGGAFSYACGSATWNLTASQAAGVDVGSTAGDLPTDAQVVALVRAWMQRW
jgi:hypothetical protein